MPWITKRIIDLPTSLFIRILHGGKTNMEKKENSQYLPLNQLGEEDYFLFKGLEPGTIILRLLEPFTKEVCSWIGENSISAFVSREERFHLLSILGEDIVKLKRKTYTTRQEKAAAKFNKEKDLVMECNEV
uniref:Cyclic nucleotide-binding domain-containing protein n=1 Tax=Meloidogyne hapla TaxID=6305 RepID=A0A1I8BT07_MELHA